MAVKKKVIKKKKPVIKKPKKPVKRAVKKVVRRIIKKVTVKSPKKNKPIGKVTHFYAHIKVAIIKFNTNVKNGTELYIRGATTDFKETAKSMQYDHKPIVTAPKGKLIGIKLKKRVREGDLVYKA